MLLQNPEKPSIFNNYCLYFIEIVLLRSKANVSSIHLDRSLFGMRSCCYVIQAPGLSRLFCAFLAALKSIFIAWSTSQNANVSRYSCFTWPLASVTLSAVNVAKATAALAHGTVSPLRRKPDHKRVKFLTRGITGTEYHKMSVKQSDCLKSNLAVLICTHYPFSIET